MTRNIKHLSLDLLDEHPENAKIFRELDEQEIGHLAGSMKEAGLVDPIVVWPKEDGRYEIISGAQRVKAAKKLNWEKIECIIEDDEEGINGKKAELRLIDANLYGRNLSPMDYARAFKRRKEILEAELGERRGRPAGKTNNDNNGSKKQCHGGNNFNISLTNSNRTITQIGKEYNVGPRTVARYLKLNDLIPELQSLVSSGKLSATVGEQLAYLKPEDQKELYDNLGEAIGELKKDEARLLRREKEKAEENMKKMQAKLDEMRKELKKGHETVTKLLEEKKVLEEKLTDPNNPQAARLKQIEDEIREKELKKQELEFQIKDLEYEIREVKNKRTKEEEAVALINRRLKALPAYKGEIEYTLNQVSEDPYGNVSRCLRKNIEVLRDIVDVMESVLKRIKA